MENNEVLQETENLAGENLDTVNQDAEVDYEGEVKKWKEAFKDQQGRAAKFEREFKDLKAKAEAKKPEERETPKNSKYSLDEINEFTALSSIPLEDRGEVMEYAERKGIKPSEALNIPLIKTFLREQEENRKSALATNTGTSKRGISKISDESIIEEMKQGKLPDTDEGLARLAEARMAMKLKK